MSAIDPRVMVHRLKIKQGHRRVKQKLRHQGIERRKAAAEDIKKLLPTGFIRECRHTKWLANVVLVRKSSGTWRMCVNFTDLNNACPKDDFSLPKWDKLVDSTVEHTPFSFMDANVGYHQIPMAEEDEVHTAFTTSLECTLTRWCPFA